jgi:hypothetical protein
MAADQWGVVNFNIESGDMLYIIEVKATVTFVPRYADSRTH